MKEAGLVGADGKPKVPASRDELVTMAKKMTKDDTFGVAIGTVNPGSYTWGFHNLLWQNGANIYASDLKRAGVADPAAIEVAEFWAALPTQHKIVPPANASCRDAFIANRLGMWIAGLVELHRPARRQGRLRGRAAAAALQAAGGVVDAAPVHLPQGEDGRSRQAARRRGPTCAG